MTEWVLVPREPTAKMVLAAFDAITNASGEGMIRARWRCMLDAAPAAPQQAEPVEIVPRVWREALRKLTFMARTSGGTPGPDEGLQTACAEAETLLSKPYNYPPAAPQQAEPALNERVGLAYKNGYEEALNDCIRNGGEAWARSMFANGGEHIKPQQAEPVAWMKPTRDSCYLRSAETMLAIHEDCDGIVRTGWKPLYLHPPADEVQRLAVDLNRLRVAAQAVTAAVYDRERLFAVAELRAALAALEGGE